ncbi:hypothetical protein A4X03_0g821 [Tilletia caries]|uniref:Uncharacterized protein n=3 Tax=Tilletia TaxID=13289 RepID=A0A8T8TPS0_9BASI|nr:hypothetical protein A4X03_0g821 [Tilletia caries]
MRVPGRDEPMGPPRELLRHRSVSRLNDAWRSTGGSPMPASAYGSPGPSSAAYPMQISAHQRTIPAGQYPIHAQSPMRYYTPSLSMGMTPGGSGSSWGNGAGSLVPEQYQPAAAGHDPYQSAYRADSVDPYAKYQPGPRSSSIGPWLRGAQPASHRGRSSSVWSSNMGYGETPGPSRMQERYSPAYPRAAPPPPQNTRPVPDHHYLPNMSSSHSRSLSELPGARRGPPHAMAHMHTPAPSHPRVVREIGSAPSAFRGPSNRALSYIRQATESAIIAASPVLRVRRPAVPRPPPASVPRPPMTSVELEPKPEVASSPAPGLLFNSDQLEEGDADPGVVEEQLSTQSIADDMDEGDGEEATDEGDREEAMDEGDREEAQDGDEEEEVIDFDDEGDDVPIAVATPIKKHSPKKSVGKRTQRRSEGTSSASIPIAVNTPIITPVITPVKQSPKKTSKKKASKSAGIASNAPRPRTEPSRPANIRTLSNWFLFAQKTKKLPRLVATRLRLSPFSRILGTDDFSRADTWVRVAGELSNDDIKKLVNEDVSSTDYIWETSLVTEARRTGPDEGFEDGTVIIKTSSGAEYALFGPMNVAMTTERTELSASFWQDVLDSGGLGEEGWEALILRALLKQSSERQQQSQSRRPRPSAPSRVLPDTKKKPKPVVQPCLNQSTTGSSKGSKSQKRVTVLDVAQTQSSHRSTPAEKAPSPSKFPRFPTQRSVEKPSSKSSGRTSPIPRGRPTREPARLVASPPSRIAVVRQALQDLGMTVSDSEDELDTLEDFSRLCFTRRKSTADSSPSKVSDLDGAPGRPLVTAVTNMQEPQLPGELSDVSDSADEWHEDPRARPPVDSQSEASSDNEQQHPSRKRLASDSDRGVASRRSKRQSEASSDDEQQYPSRKRPASDSDRSAASRRSKRVRTPASARKWWEVASPSKSKPIPRTLVETNRRTFVKTRRQV